MVRSADIVTFLPSGSELTEKMLLSKLSIDVPSSEGITSVLEQVKVFVSSGSTNFNETCQIRG